MTGDSETVDPLGNLTSTHNIYQTNLINAVSVTQLSDKLIDIFQSSLKGLKKLNPNHQISSAIEHHSKIMTGIRSSPVVSDLFPIMYRQQTVLMVSAFEAYMSDLVRCVGTYYRTIITWPISDKDGNKKGGIDLDLLSSDATTIGDIVLSVVEQRQISFQDLGSTKKFLEDYLGIAITVSESEEEKFIIATSIRHLIVHKGSRVDRQFLRQIRNTSVANKYKEGDLITIEYKELQSFMYTFSRLGKKIYLEIVRKAREANQ